MRSDLDLTTVEVAIGQTTGLTSAPTRVWVANFELPWAEARNVRDLAEALIADHPTVPYFIREQGGRTSWGGDSGETLEVWLFLADQLTSGVVGVAASLFFERLRSRQADRGRREPWHEPLTLAEAVEFAKWKIAQRYRRWADGTQDVIPSSHDELELIADSRDVAKDIWEISLRDTHGATYRVTIMQIDGIPITTLIEREAPAAS